MKKLILLLSILFSLGITSAQEYPEKINKGKKLIKIQNFRGIYSRIYDDINNEDLVKVCEKTFRWPEFWENEKPIYSIRNCQNLRNKSELTEFIHLENKNPQKFNIFWNNFQSRFQLEMDLLRIENDLRRKTSLDYIFADGAEKQKDSPFDIILDLNEIDKVFFGEKIEIPDLMFAKKTDKELTEKIPVDDNDNWLEQIEGNHKSKEDSFSEYYDNFAGSLWQQKESIFRNKLNANALWLVYVGKTMGDAVDTNGTFTPSGFTADTHSIPAKSSDKPESIELATNTLPQLNAFIQKYIKEQSVIAINADNGSRSGQLDKINMSSTQKKAEITTSLDIFERENNRQGLSNDSNIMSANLSKMSQYIDFFRDKIKTINDDIYPPFLNKPQHSS